MELSELHKKHPVIRTGPNMLSYGHERAIKDIYGHNTKCIKDGAYSVPAGSHFNLADVVDKPDHARKRKVLSSADDAGARVRVRGHQPGVCSSETWSSRHISQCIR